MVSRYLFQSWVRASAGAKLCLCLPAEWLDEDGPPWMGIAETRWLEADAGALRSKIRRWESEETEEITDGE